MLGRELQDLVRRRLWELGRTVDEASRKSRWVVPSETLLRMTQAGGRTFISDGMAAPAAHPEARRVVHRSLTRDV